MENSFNLSTISNEYNMLMTSLHISVSKHLLNDDFQVIWANRFFYDKTGYTKEEYDQNFHGSVRLYFSSAPEEYQTIEKAVKDALTANQRGYDAVCKMPRKDGSSIWIRFIGTFTNESIDGVPVIYVVYTDVNDLVNARTKVEKEHSKSQNMLRKELQTMECLKRMYGCMDMAEYMDDILYIIGTFLEAERAYMFEINDTKMDCIYEWCRADIVPQMDYCQRMDIKLLEPWYEEFCQGKSIVIPNADALKEENTYTFEVLHKQRIHSMVLSPIVMHDQLTGFIGADNSNVELLMNTSMMETLSYFIGISIEKSELNDKLIYHSFYDELTGAFNRNKYLQDIEKLCQSDSFTSLGVVYMDINGLKDINDHMGHKFGDQILIEGAEMLKKAFPAGDIYRLGGDEFVVLINGIGQSALEDQVVNLKHYILLSTNCKGAVGSIWTDKVTEIDSKISEADELMYKDKMDFYRKNPTSNRYRFHNDTILQFSDKSKLEEEIADGRFEVYLQPKVDFNRHIIGGEALIRYHDHQGKLIMPNDFINYLENARGIHYIDFFVFETICKLLEKWKKENLLLKPVSVNFSRYTLRIPEYIEMLNAIWERYDVDKSLLEIEIIENDENYDNDFLISIIDKIKKAGFAISIDDFGSRYSNMALFINADLNTLKVDKRLMDDIDHNKRSQMLISSLVQICHSLHMRLIAEGVENEKQFSILQELGCDGVQGFLISRPVQIEQYENLFLK